MVSVGNASSCPRVLSASGPTHESRFQMPEPLYRGSPARTANVELPWSLTCAVATYTLWLDPI